MKTSSRTLFALIASVIFTVTLSLFFGCQSEDFKLPGRRGTMLISYNIPNRWSYKFHTLNGRVNGYIKARNDNAQLIHSSEFESGTIVFKYIIKTTIFLLFTLIIRQIRLRAFS